jgi:hypothetical protein
MQRDLFMQLVAQEGKVPQWAKDGDAFLARTGLNDEIRKFNYGMIIFASARAYENNRAFERKYEDANLADDATGGAPEGAESTGKGFNKFSDAKKFLGSPGEGKQWHHIVEQSQINRSGFNTMQVQNTNNLIAVDKVAHAKISGYYSSIDPRLSDSMRVRDWLAGQSFETQYQFGADVLSRLGVMK